MTEQTKTCPFCAETIKAAAVVCRFCNRDINNVDAKTSSANAVALRNCPDCHGRGDFKETCPGCGGTHYEQCGQCYGDGWTTDGYGRDTCTNCRGSGREMCMCCPNSQGYDEVTCESCQGTGQLTHEAFGALMQKKQEVQTSGRSSATGGRASTCRGSQAQRRRASKKSSGDGKTASGGRGAATRSGSAGTTGRATTAGELTLGCNQRKNPIKSLCDLWAKVWSFSEEGAGSDKRRCRTTWIVLQKTTNQYGRCWNCFSTRTV